MNVKETQRTSSPCWHSVSSEDTTWKQFAFSNTAFSTAKYHFYLWSPKTHSLPPQEQTLLRDELMNESKTKWKASTDIEATVLCQNLSVMMVRTHNIFPSNSREMWLSESYSSHCHMLVLSSKSLQPHRVTSVPPDVHVFSGPSQPFWSAHIYTNYVINILTLHILYQVRKMTKFL